MKVLLATILTSCFLLPLTSAIGQTDKSITDRILYTVRFDDGQGKESGFYNHIDSTTRANLINLICDLVSENKLSAATYWGDYVSEIPNYQLLRPESAKIYFNRNDSLRYTPNKPPYNNGVITEIARDDYLYRYLVNSLSFYENWSFDMARNKFIKNVKGVILFKDKYTHNIGMNCNYFVPLNDTSENEYASRNIVVKNIIYDVPVTKGDTILDEYNWWHNYIEASKRERFFNLLEYKALEDTVLPFKTFNGTYPYDTLIKKTEYINTGLAKLFYGRSLWQSSDPLLFGMTAEKIRARSFELDDWTSIKKIRFHETWYFDPDRLRFEKKVLGIGMIVDTFNDEGKRVGEKCLVYYRMNE